MTSEGPERVRIWIRTSRPDDVSRTWMREAPMWWRPGPGDLIEFEESSGAVFEVERAHWTLTELVVWLRSPEIRNTVEDWREQYDMLRETGFDPGGGRMPE